MKILSIGNSFSQDAQRWLHAISLVGNRKIDTFNLFIGGCSLETHWDCIINNKPDYDYMGNNIESLRKASVNEVIENEKFDIVTIQQASSFSGKPQSYIPYMFDLADFVKKYQPDAKIYFHKSLQLRKRRSFPLQRRVSPFGGLRQICRRRGLV